MPTNAAMVMAGPLLVALLLVVLAFSLSFRTSRMRHEERMRMIEKGIAPPPAFQGWPGVKQQEQQLRFEERRLLIEKGLPVPEFVPGHASDHLRTGIVTLCLGIAGGIAFVLFGSFPMPEGPLVRTWLAVLSPVLALFGIGCLVYYAIAPKRAP